MLSNPTNNLHNRQRHHRRQQSTPTAFEPVKAHILPNVQKQGLHRRGMSLDTRRRTTPPQDPTTNRTNTGYTTTQQHNLRETQQQRPIRPGPNARFQNFDNDENYLRSPTVTPQRQSFDLRQDYGPQYSFSEPINTPTNVSFFDGNNDFNTNHSGHILTPTGHIDFSQFDAMEFPSQRQNQRPSASRRISGGIVGRVAQFEQLALNSPKRPATPPHQNISNYFPLTPAGTPHHRTIKQEPINQRFLDSYDTSMEETIKPRGNQRSRGVFEEMRRHAENSYPSPAKSRAAELMHFEESQVAAPNSINLNALDMNFLKLEPHHDGLLYTGISAEPSPGLSYLSTPEIQDAAMFENAFAQDEFSCKSAAFQDFPGNLAAPTTAGHRISESTSSMVAAAEEPMLDTGITLDDIAAFISGPDPVDSKWVCLYPECNKKFGRKENIKSHVQTHLGDRQYQCPHCNNRFVRQHDLKRHAKIHSGIKPYPCRCGNSFARHDALTRHRQRGMCIGAFEGVVKKTVKRGRPRKNRPEDDKRVEKSSRTRAKNKGKAMSSASSTSGYSESSGAQSPRSEVELSDNHVFEDFALTHASNTQFPQMESPLPECVSPQAMQAHSPSVFSSHTMSRTTSASCYESIPSPQQLPPLPASPTKSTHSYHSPPGLCESSSSPAPSQYYDMDNMSSHEEDLSKLSLANISEADEMFLEAFGSNTDMSALERDPGLLLNKFDDSYGQNSDMFNDPNDVFFGSP